jgi:hypothetical protein
MPAEPKYGLPARTTMAGALRIGRFAKRGWGRPKTERWPRFLNSDSPHPSFRRTAKGSERASEFIGPDRVVAPIRIESASLTRRADLHIDAINSIGTPAALSSLSNTPVIFSRFYAKLYP